MNYTLVESESELQARLKQRACVVAAGMTDLYPSGQLSHTDRDLLDITRVASLSGIIPTDDGWRIGATTSWRAILDYPWPPGLALLAEVAGQVGAVQVQNAATVAGNLCNASPAADSVPALLALDATVELASASGTRMLPLADFITGVRRTAIRDDEYLRAICLPAVPEPAASAFVKLGLRAYLVISIAMAGGVVRVDSSGRVEDVALSLGACSPVAVRLPAIEAALRGQPVSAALIDCVTPERVQPAIQPIDDVRASAAYRADAAVQVVRDTVAQMIERLA